MLEFTKLKNIVEDNNTFILTTHVNPDADAIGSQMALYFVLKKLGKTVYAINHSNTPYNLTFLDKESVIQKYKPEVHDKVFEEADVLIALDLNHSNRLISMERVFTESGKIKVCIDHHQEPENFVDHLYVDTEYSATGAIIHDFVKKTGIVELDYDMAIEIYAAIMTDTGSFRFERTTATTHMVAAELLELGVDPNYVADEIYDQGPYTRLKLLGEALNTLTITETGNVSYMTIKLETIEKMGGKLEEIDGFVKYTMQVKGVKVGLLFYEIGDGIKISFRSKGDIPVNKLAGEFGGGGHLNAAGARIENGKIEDYIIPVTTAAEKYIS